MQNQIIYKEGDKHEFRIKKEIQVSDNEKYFVLQDTMGRKQLLNSKFYEKYKLKIGQNIICKVDHINCAGKIFLEPKHPFYVEGNIYKLKIHRIKLSKNRIGEDVLQLFFIDKMGNEATCKIENESSLNYNIGDVLRCKVELIKKGKLYLLNNDNNFYYKIGEYYYFKIIDVKELSDGFTYYILQDNFQKKHLLRFEYYENYNLKIGNNIKCMILKFSSEAYYILEPKHPYYEIDKVYNFDFLKQTKDVKSQLINAYEISVKDIFNKEIIFTTNKSLLIDSSRPHKIRCKVIGIKKGKALLSVID